MAHGPGDLGRTTDGQRTKNATRRRVTTEEFANQADEKLDIASGNKAADGPASGPTSDAEEYSSLKVALTVMLLSSVLVFVTGLVGIRIFIFEFYLAIVYAPTVLLVIAWFLVRRRDRVIDSLDTRV